MADITYFVALPFVAADDGVAPGEPVECLSAGAAILRAEYLSRREGIVGAIAFSRSGDLSSGTFEDAQVLKAIRQSSAAIARASDLLVSAWQRGGRLFLVGAGTSGRHPAGRSLSLAPAARARRVAPRPRAHGRRPDRAFGAGNQFGQ